MGRRSIPQTSGGKIYLKGSTSGDIAAIVEGYLTESTAGNGIYDQYQVNWRIGRLGTMVTSATINLNGTLSYQNYLEFLDTELYVLQTSMEGIVSAHYSNPISIVLTQLRVIDESNPYYGQGFSIISYVSDIGSGEGWTYDKKIRQNVIELKGMFTNPLLGIVYARLDERSRPRKLSVAIERIDLGLPPQPDLKVKVWGPQRVSPGQKIDYIIEYRNDGLRASEETLLFVALDYNLKYISASEGAFYNDILNTVDWNLGNLPAKSSGYLTIQAEVVWGLPQGTTLETDAIINELLPHSDKKGVFVNGIGLYVGKNRNERYSDTCNQFASSKDLEWVEAYNTGSGPGDVFAVIDATNGIATEHNGLKSDLLINKEYERTEGYSGGTRTVVTAIEMYGLKVKELVLISPVNIMTLELEVLHSAYGVEKIIIYQSEKDRLRFGELYQLKISKNDPLRNQPWIEVRDRDYTHTLWLQKLDNETNKNKENMSSATPHIIAAACDPNIKYGPEGDVLPGQRLNYKIEYENEGEGIAYGVYFTDTLDKNLDDLTLEIGPVIDVKTGQKIGEPGIYYSETRTITWFVGEVGSKQGGYAEFSVNVKNDAPNDTEIINFATVYFPSVPEATRTNGTVNRVITAMDNIPPVTTATVSPSANQVGWNNTDVTINLSATDNEEDSGIKEIHYKLTGAVFEERVISGSTAQIYLTTEGMINLTYYATDSADNVESAKSLEIKIDKTQPLITVQVSPQPNANGWNNTAVTVSFTATDVPSGIADVAEPVLVNTEGADRYISGEAVDLAGNEATANVLVNIDKTAPEVIITTPVEGAQYLLNARILASWLATDTLSGMASAVGTVPSGSTVNTTSVGSKSFSVVAMDKAGNKMEVPLTYNVRYSYGGILPPINQDGSSIFKLGRVAPVKFQLKDDVGNYISTAVARIYLNKISNNVMGNQIEAESVGQANTDNLFRYSSTDNQYIFNLGTSNLSEGSWQIKIVLDDGSSKYTTVSFK